MSKSYVKPCIYCKAEIEISDKEGKWLPYNKDGSAHECRKTNETAEQKKESRPKITTIDGIAAVELIPYINRQSGFYFNVSEYKGTAVVEVYADE